MYRLDCGTFCHCCTLARRQDPDEPYQKQETGDSAKSCANDEAGLGASQVVGERNDVRLESAARELMGGLVLCV